ncbi:MAG TPA: hypothetical protein VL346_02410 [Acidobacteriaceae bacterium]|nr:hypothetical protein [Acidobacteriaceae bacterium]
MLPEEIAFSLSKLQSKNSEDQNEAFTSLMAATDRPVDWAYDIWADLLALLKAGDNRQRAIASQALCNLAESDPAQRMLQDLPALIEVTRDERFVTARHCMQSLWKIGVVGNEQRKLLLKSLSNRFQECASEKNCTLIRYDILESVRRVYDATSDAEIPRLAASLMDLEGDPKYKKKYATLWQGKLG